MKCTSVPCPFCVLMQPFQDEQATLEAKIAKVKSFVQLFDGPFHAFVMTHTRIHSTKKGRFLVSFDVALKHEYVALLVGPLSLQEILHQLGAFAMATLFTVSMQVPVYRVLLSSLCFLFLDRALLKNVCSDVNTTNLYFLLCWREIMRGKRCDHKLKG